MFKKYILSFLEKLSSVRDCFMPVGRLFQNKIPLEMRLFLEYDVSTENKLQQLERFLPSQPKRISLVPDRKSKQEIDDV